MQSPNFSLVDLVGNSTSSSDAGTILVPCGKLRDHPLRLNSYDKMYLRELELSISRYGILSPLLVRSLDDGCFQVIAGHYRLRAALRLGYQECPVTIIDCDDITAKALLATSNYQERYFTAMEEGLIIRDLHQQDRLDFTDIGRLFNKSKSWVSRRLSLVLSLDEILQDDVQKGFLKARTAQEIALLPRGNQLAFARCVMENSLSKDEASSLVQAIKKSGFQEDIFNDCIVNPRVFLENQKSAGRKKKVGRDQKNSASKVEELISSLNRTNIFLQKLINYLESGKMDHLSTEERLLFQKACSSVNLTTTQFARVYMKATLKTTV